MPVTTNKNFLSPKNFRFVLNRAPNLEYFCQTAAIPGDRLLFNELNITFRVDEDLKTYLEIFNWMIALGFPESFEQYTLNSSRTETVTDTSIVTDAKLFVTTNTMNPNYIVTFRDMYPISISELNFDTKDTEADYIEVSVSFVYRDFKIERYS